MSITSNQRTLAYQLARPLCTARDMGDVRLPALAAKIAPYYAGTADDLGPHRVDPETEAIRFYLLQHAMADVRLKYAPEQVLPQDALDVAEAYHRECNALAVRMFYYLTLICTREARHCKGGSAWYTKVEAKFGPEITSLLRSFPGNSGGAAKKMLNDSPDVALIDYVQALVFTFNHGSWGTSYGGPAWGGIAEALESFVDGTFTPEMMLDRAFNLAHNTAPIFNKGMIFSSQTSDILKVLDVQAAGMIPKLVAERTHLKRWVTPEIITLHQTCAKAIGESFLGFVDWYQVDAMGKGFYGAQKQIQVTTHGAASSPYAAKEAAKKEEAETAKAAEFFQIHSTLALKKIPRP